MPEMELDPEKKYKMPAPLFFKKYGDKTLVVARDSANWLLLHNERQVEVFRLLADGYRVVDVFQCLPPDAQCDIYPVLIELEAKRFEDVSVRYPQEHGMYVYLTNACNQHCRHCYMYAGSERTAELTTQEITALLEHFSGVGGKVITFTGGEATIRPDFITILAAAKNLGLTVCVLTNGVLWNQKFIQKVIPYLDEVQISIDGFDAESYRAVRRSEAFADVLAAVDRLVSAGMRVTVAITPLLETLLGHEKQYIDFANAMLARYKNNKFFVKFNTELMDGRDISPTSRENDQYREAIQTIKAQCAPLSEEEGFVIDHQNNTIFNNCGYGGLSIASNGDVYFCNLISKCAKQGNIRTNSFEKIWADAQKARTLSDVSHLMPCKDCALRYICGGGCRVKHFTNLVETVVHAKLDMNSLFFRDSACTEEQKNRFYRLMIETNSLFYR